MMKDHSPQVQIIGQLAREYEEKYTELQESMTKIPGEQVIPYLRALAERSTDRFRSAQIALLSIEELFEGKDSERAIMAATALGRAFDEMRILFQFFLENQAGARDSS